MKYEILNTGISIIIGALSYLVGGFDSLLIALLVVMGCDWVTGVLKALKKGKFSPKVGLWGIVNKMVVLIVVTMINFIQVGVGIELPIRETVISMLLINEGLSVLGNASMFVSGLEPLSKYFETFKIKLIKIFEVGE